MGTATATVHFNRSHLWLPCKRVIGHRLAPARTIHSIDEQASACVEGCSPMYDTKNDLPIVVRTRMAELLNALLADAIDLGAQAKQAHWNVKGPNFIALHELFDQVAEHVEDHID